LTQTINTHFQNQVEESIVNNINITDTTTIITTAAGLEEKIKASVSFQKQISKDQNQDK